MKTNRTTFALFAIFGCCLLAVSLLTGCSGSAEGKGIRINTSSGESSDENEQFQSP